MVAAPAEDRYYDLPELPGYMSVAQACKLFKLSKQGMYYRIFDLGQFRTVYRVGGGREEEGERRERPFLLLVKDEVMRVYREEQEAQGNEQSAREKREALNQFHRRVKDWGLANDWTQSRISPKGRPHEALVRAYEKAHPKDRRPA